MLMLSSLFLAGFLLLALFFQRRHRSGWGLVLIGLGLLLSRYYPPIQGWIDGLGVDSFSEAQSFTWKEAWFFLGTLSTILVVPPWRDYLLELGLSLVIVLVCLV